MANHKRDTGRETLEKKGWWRSRRQLVLRRLCRFFVLGMFSNGPWFGMWTLHGNYSSGLSFDTVPLTDPLMTLQSLASGHLPAIVTLTGAVIITVLYALAGKQLFCSWVYPPSPIIDLANWLHRRFDLNQSAAILRRTRYTLLVIVLVGPALTGMLIWEWIDPVSLMGRSLVMGFDNDALLIFALLLFDLLVVEHGWCGYIYSVGALYGVLGNKGAITVAATDRQKHDRCTDCLHVYLEPHVLRASVLDEQSPVQVTNRDCMTCGHCMDVCSEDAFIATTRRSSGVKS